MMTFNLKNRLFVPFAGLFVLSLFTSLRSIEHEEKTNHILSFYEQLDSGSFSRPDYDLFERGLTGYFNLREDGLIKEDRNFLTLVDFRLSSTEERMWVIDLKEAEIKFQTVVAHGKNTGVEYARHFSNRINSNQSSLGFYLTSETYIGKHGLSLRLDGLEESFNDNARTRAVVMHGAEYADEDFTFQYGRLGRSFGCPAIPTTIHKEVIQTLEQKGVLFIYYPQPEYETQTLLNDRERAESYLASLEKGDQIGSSLAALN